MAKRAYVEVPYVVDGAGKLCGLPATINGEIVNAYQTGETPGGEGRYKVWTDTENLTAANLNASWFSVGLGIAATRWGCDPKCLREGGIVMGPPGHTNIGKLFVNMSPGNWKVETNPDAA